MQIVYPVQERERKSKPCSAVCSSIGQMLSASLTLSGLTSHSPSFQSQLNKSLTATKL